MTGERLLSRSKNRYQICKIIAFEYMYRSLCDTSPASVTKRSVAEWSVEDRAALLIQRVFRYHRLMKTTFEDAIWNDRAVATLQNLTRLTRRAREMW